MLASWAEAQPLHWKRGVHRKEVWRTYGALNFLWCYFPALAHWANLCHTSGAREVSSFTVSIAEDRAHTRYMGHDIAASANIWKEKRQVLKIKRDSLFGEYVKRPDDCHLALEIKRIDDEIAEGNQKEQEGNERPKVRRQQTLASS